MKREQSEPYSQASYITLSQTNNCTIYIIHQHFFNHLYDIWCLGSCQLSLLHSLKRIKSTVHQLWPSFPRKTNGPIGHIIHTFDASVMFAQCLHEEFSQRDSEMLSNKGLGHVCVIGKTSRSNLLTHCDLPHHTPLRESEMSSIYLHHLFCHHLAAAELKKV